MASASFGGVRKLSPIGRSRLRQSLRRQSPGVAPRSLYISEREEDYRTGLRKSCRAENYDSFDNLPTDDTALLLKFPSGRSRS